MTIYPDPPMTLGEARAWARRLRKVGFSPVSCRRYADERATGRAGGHFLRCNWPFDLADLPPDLRDVLVHHDYGEDFAQWGEVQLVSGRRAAARLLARFRAVRLGMGSRPLPAVALPDAALTFAPVARIAADYDDWPPGSQTHPDYLAEVAEIVAGWRRRREAGGGVRAGP